MVKLKGKHSGMNTRLESLFKQLEMEPRWVGDDFAVMDKDYTARPVEKSKRFLELLNATN